MDSCREIRTGNDELRAGLIMGIPGALLAVFVASKLTHNMPQSICVGAFVNMAGMTMVVMSYVIKNHTKPRTAEETGENSAAHKSLWQKCVLESEFTGLLVAWFVPVVVIAWYAKLPNLLYVLVVLGLLLRPSVLCLPFVLLQRVQAGLRGVKWPHKSPSSIESKTQPLP